MRAHDDDHDGRPGMLLDGTGPCRGVESGERRCSRLVAQGHVVTVPLMSSLVPAVQARSVYRGSLVIMLLGASCCVDDSHSHAVATFPPR